ncbi:MAG: DUF2493 domain-containing protein [Prevotella sp.]|nr:DUF2493 domain-containing protein [Prevotella sp.]
MSDYPPFRVIIAGTRSFNDYELLRDSCNNLLSEKQRTHTVVVISGTARGADQMGERYARERGFQLRRFPADWEQYGKSAGHIRNAKMADNADALIAFWDGESKGTKNMIDNARRKGLAVRVIQYQKPK